MTDTTTDLAIATGIAIACCLVVRTLYRDPPGLLAAFLTGLCGGFGGGFLGLFPASLLIELGVIDAASQKWVMSVLGTLFALIFLSWYGRGLLRE